MIEVTQRIEKILDHAEHNTMYGSPEANEEAGITTKEAFKSFL